MIRLSNTWEYDGINAMLQKGSVNLVKDIVTTGGSFHNLFKIKG